MLRVNSHMREYERISVGWGIFFICSCIIVFQSFSHSIIQSIVVVLCVVTVVVGLLLPLPSRGKCHPTVVGI